MAVKLTIFPAELNACVWGEGYIVGAGAELASAPISRTGVQPLERHSCVMRSVLPSSVNSIGILTRGAPGMEILGPKVPSPLPKRTQNRR